jgi:DNA-binding CsgD family transcriptional regulator
MKEVNQLSNREQDVVKLLLQGKSNKLIASALGISERTVEFHLKNIYAKFQVRSRIELILTLGNATGMFEIEKLVDSTVDSVEQSAENRDRIHSRRHRTESFVDITYTIGKEFEMKSLLTAKHVHIGVLTAVFTGLLWSAILLYDGRFTLEEFWKWVVPLIIILIIIGLSVGWIGKRNGITLRKVFFSTLAGTGLSPFTIIPFMFVVVWPLGKLAEWFGFFEPSSMPSEVATFWAAVVMLVIWLLVGITVGVTLLFVTIKKPEPINNQKHAVENGLH